MEINATLIGQMLVFGILYWFSWKFIWPPPSADRRSCSSRTATPQ
jgi:F0F1-type ATP synthase membrane subunit b/b'